MWGDFHPWGRDNRRSTHQSPHRLCRRAHLSNIWDEWAEIRHGKAIHQVFRTASFLYSVRSSPYFRSQIIFYLHSMPHYSALKWETERKRGSDGGWQWGWGGGVGWREYSAASPVSLSEANISSFLKMDFWASSPQVDTWSHQAGNKQRVKEFESRFLTFIQRSQRKDNCETLCFFTPSSKSFHYLTAPVYLLVQNGVLALGLKQSHQPGFHHNVRLPCGVVWRMK